MSLPTDHTERVVRARLSLEGLAIGDALGEMLSANCAGARQRVERGLIGGPWFHTDDTEMALSIFDELRGRGRIQPDELAQRFADRFQADPERGYGKMARIILREIWQGVPWQQASAGAFGGTGSLGNGSAMRVAPLGAYFSAESDTTIGNEAALSAVVTHAHPEGKAGAIAVAIAAATAWRLRELPPAEAAPQLLHAAHDNTPEGETKVGLAQALNLPLTTSTVMAGRFLGNGSAVTAPDTVPFCLWSAAKHLGNYREAIIETATADGDCDTNCAIVGGIVVLYAGLESIPKDWREARERFDFEKR